MKTAGLALAVGILMACASDPPARADRPQPQPPAQAAASQERHTLVPRVEHHTHLVGPTAIDPAPPPMPPVELPADLDAVLTARARLSGTSDPSDLFTEDVQVLDVTSGQDLWERGRDAAADLTRAYPAGTIWTPTAYAVTGNTAWIAGGSRPAELPEDDMHFTLGLKKLGGRWRIALEHGTVKPPRLFAAPITADSVIERLDEAGIERAVVISVAYWMGSPDRSGPGEYDKVRAENDWVVAEVARYPRRLVAICAVNPLKDYALQELARCAKLPGVKGIKVHFANSRVNLEDRGQLQTLKRFFREANAQRLAIIGHFWVGPEYARKHASIILEELFPEAPDVPIQIAHFGAAGAYAHDDAIHVFAKALEAKDPRMKNAYLDLATVVTDGQPKETLELIARRIRQAGVDRVLFGTDTYLPSRPAPVQAWATIRSRLPLTDDEVRVLAGNVAPYLR